MRGTCIINYWSFENVGGIEVYLHKFVSYLTTNDYKVIWLCYKEPKVAKSFREVMLSDKVERVHVEGRGCTWFSYEPFSLNLDYPAIILSFSPLTMAISQKIINDFGNPRNLKSIYTVANAKGESYYLEQNFKLLRPLVNKRMQKIIREWNQCNLIRYFSPLHITNYESTYKIVSSDKDALLLKSLALVDTPDMKMLTRKARRSNFTIITVGRFDFPHKGYMLGLVNAFGRLKSSYPKLKLTIIGFGPGEAELRNRVKNLPLEYQRDVNFIGEVPPDRLKSYFDNAHLNVSVAGAAIVGCRNGVITLPARNFCTGECEVYGFLPQSADRFTSLEPGEIVDPYIEKVINMSEDEFIAVSLDSFNSVRIDESDIDPLYYFHTVSICKEYSISRSDYRFIRLLSYLIKFVNRLKLIMN